MVLPTNYDLAILAALCVAIAFLAGAFAHSEIIRIINERAERRHE